MPPSPARGKLRARPFVAVRGLKVADLMAHDACKPILIGDHVVQAFENADLPTGQGEGVERTILFYHAPSLLRFEEGVLRQCLDIFPPPARLQA